MTRAITWVCSECSDEQQQAMLVCGKCMTAEHEEHFAEEVIY